MKKIRFTSPINLSASGKQRRFKILAYAGGVLKVDGFPQGVVIDLAGLDSSRSVPILIDHKSDIENTLGQTSEITNDGRSLSMSGLVTGVSRTAKQVIEQSNAGHVWSASVGCSVTSTEEISAGETAVVNGQRFSGPVTIARKAVLRETSVLPVPADNQSLVNLAATGRSLKGNSIMTFEEFIQSLGLEMAGLNPALTTLLRKEFDAQQAEPAEENPEASAHAVLNLRASASAELNRQSQILATCQGFPHISETAIRLGWSVVQAENHVLKAQARQMTPSNRRINAGHSGGITKNHLVASLLLRAGGEAVAIKAYGADVCQQARDLRCGSLVDLAAAALRLSGQDPQSHQSNDQMIRAAFSTANLSNILGDSVGKSLVDAYEETTSDWKKFCHIGDAESFRDQKGVRPAAIASLEELGDGGKIKHGSLSEEDVYTWNVSTFAKMISVTRGTIVNDDLNFLSELAPMFGNAVGRTLQDLVWETILGGQVANYFSSGNANLATTASALDSGTLATAVAAMKNQRDDNGYDLNIQPVALVVPPALEMTARALLNSKEILGTSGPNGNPTQNIVANLIVEPRISNTTRFSNATAIQWFLFGAPKDRAVTVGFLRGQKQPTIETSDTDFNTLGMQIRAYHDFGCALADPRGAYKAVGTAP